MPKENSFIQKHQELWKFIKFTFTGLSTTLLYYAVYYLLYYVIFKSLNNVPVTDNAVLSFLGIEYKGDMYEFFIASLISYIASYIMNRKVTFHADSNLVLSTILYIIMVLVTVAFSTWFGAFMMSWVRNHNYENFLVVTLVNLIVILVPFLWTYPLQRFVIHRKKKTLPDESEIDEGAVEENETSDVSSEENEAESDPPESDAPENKKKKDDTPKDGSESLEKLPFVILAGTAALIAVCVLAPFLKKKH